MVEELMGGYSNCKPKIPEQEVKPQKKKSAGKSAKKGTVTIFFVFG